LPQAASDANAATDVTVVYLCRGADGGVDAARRFVNSSTVHPAGMPHRLLAIMKGWDDPAVKTQAEELIRAAGGMTHDLPDDGFDLGAYFRAAEAVETTWIFLLNTHSEILVDNWLKMLFAAAGCKGVGAAGATGSCGGMAPTLALYPPMLRRLYRTVSLPRFLLRSVAMLLVHYPLKRWGWRRWPGFPNPNLRTNALLIRTNHLRAFAHEAGIPQTKTDAWSIENGSGSLTRWLEGQGLAVVVVDQDGRAHAPGAWHLSGTFRSPGQPNLIVADNQTRRYDNADPWEKQMLETAAWGRSLSSGVPHEAGGTRD
jgi:hypothetical protein